MDLFGTSQSPKIKHHSISLYIYIYQSLTILYYYITIIIIILLFIQWAVPLKFISQPVGEGHLLLKSHTHTRKARTKRKASKSSLCNSKLSPSMEDRKFLPNSGPGSKWAFLSNIFNRLLAFFDIFDVVCKMLGNVSRWASHGSNSQPITIKAISV